MENTESMEDFVNLTMVKKLGVDGYRKQTYKALDQYLGFLKTTDNPEKIQTYIDSAYRILDFISNYEIEERDRKLISLLGERKVMLFEQFKKRLH